MRSSCGVVGRNASPGTAVLNKMLLGRQDRSTPLLHYRDVPARISEHFRVGVRPNRSGSWNCRRFPPKGTRTRTELGSLRTVNSDSQKSRSNRQSLGSDCNIFSRREYQRISVCCVSKQGSKPGHAGVPAALAVEF